VLITLGIIGIVAALTLPSLVASYKEKVNVTKLKKAYSAMSQAYAQAVNEYGTPDNWDLVGDSSLVGAQNLIEKLQPYLKFSSGPSQREIYLSDGQLIRFSIRSANCTQNRGGGSLANTCASFDICLGSKGCTAPGVDYFLMNITKDGIIPHGIQDDTAYSFENSCLKPSSANVRYGCTAWVIFNENMDYLHCDNLSWDGLTKCD
jgi:type II secretory pathway pseudopilin PulG